MLRTCVVNCNSLLAIDIATYLVMRFCRRDGATSPVVNLAALLWLEKAAQKLWKKHFYGIVDMLAM